MILSDSCWFTDKCKKYADNQCEPNTFCIKLFKMDYLYTESLLSEHQRKHLALHFDADGTDREEFKKLKSIQDAIEEFVTSGSNLYIHSSTPGNGKTSWAVRMIQTYFNSIWHKCGFECKALFINVPRFLLALKDSISKDNFYVDHIKKCVLSADLVVWDEIGIKELTNFEHEHLLNLINTRLDYNKSNIYTSNLQGEILKEKLGERLYSRVVNNSYNIELHGQDKRGLQ